MMSQVDLLTVLRPGWETSRQAWQLLARSSVVSLTPEAVGSTGLELDQLAHQLQRLGYSKPARLALTAATVLNGFADQSIGVDGELTDLTSQIVAILAEMLLELETTGQIRTEEPVEIVDQLQGKWGLVISTGNAQNCLSPPAPFPSHATDSTLPAESRRKLVTTSEELVDASESLLHRVDRDGNFPYMATLSRIHHLGITLRDCIDAFCGKIRQRDPEAPREASSVATIFPQPLAGLPRPVADDCPIDDPGGLENDFDATESSPDLHALETTFISECYGTSVPKVLIVDESPFFRLLLTTAMEMFGYSARAVENLAEMQSTCDCEAWDLVIHGGDQSLPESCRDWLRGRLAVWNAPLVSLTHDRREPEEGMANHYPFRRTDISEVLKLIHVKLGPVPLAMRKIA
jgi:CheY-like chemotaxis protein